MAAKSRATAEELTPPLILVSEGGMVFAFRLGEHPRCAVGGTEEIATDRLSRITDEEPPTLHLCRPCNLRSAALGEVRSSSEGVVVCRTCALAIDLFVEAEAAFAKREAHRARNRRKAARRARRQPRRH